MEIAPARGTVGGLARLAASVLLAAAVAACASPPEEPLERAAWIEANDPIEDVNRQVFAFDMAVFDFVVRPLSELYGAIPPVYRQGVRNVFNNLHMPATALNSGLQGDWDNAFDAGVSFFINTTAGLGGVFDIPGGFGEAPRREDFGQTLAVWGADEGPYLVLPLAGPSTLRDTAGRVVDALTSPLSYLLPTGWSYVGDGVEAVQEYGDNRDEIEALRESSLDFYAAMRSLYRQHRARQIADGGGDPLAFDLLDSDPLLFDTLGEGTLGLDLPGEGG